MTANQEFTRSGECVSGAFPARFCRTVPSAETNVSALPRLPRLAALVVAVGALSGAANAEPSVMRPDRSAGFTELAFSSDLVAIARRDLGKTGPQMGLPSRLWCGYAANRWRKAAGLSAPKSGLAVAHASHGRKVARPVVGAMLITRRAGGGHVSIITAVHGDGTVTAISGNDARRVRERRRSARGLIVIPA